jgi:hypothetical protein
MPQSVLSVRDTAPLNPHMGGQWQFVLSLARFMDP